MAKVSVATSTTEILASSTAKTKLIILENMGANNIWCNVGAAAALDTGFLLSPNYGPLVLDCQKFGDLNAAINAIAETGATNVSAQRI